MLIIFYYPNIKAESHEIRNLLLWEYSVVYIILKMKDVDFLLHPIL